jgi:hypothetical protein
MYMALILLRDLFDDQGKCMASLYHPGGPASRPSLSFSHPGMKTPEEKNADVDNEDYIMRLCTLRPCSSRACLTC